MKPLGKFGTILEFKCSKSKEYPMKTRTLSLVAALLAFGGGGGGGGGLFAFIPKEEVKVDINASSVKWTGYHLAKSYEHHGTVKLKSGKLIMDGDQLMEATIVIDMPTISNSDLTDPKKNAKLVKHLNSKDFFYTENFPEAWLKTTRIRKLQDGKYEVDAEISIRGMKSEIEFEINQSRDGDANVFEGKVTIDRSKHEVLYGWSVENVIISNNFDLDFRIVATK